MHIVQSYYNFVKKSVTTVNLHPSTTKQKAKNGLNQFEFGNGIIYRPSRPFQERAL